MALDSTSTKILDQKMQKGYVLLSENKLIDAVHEWSEAWSDIKHLMAEQEIPDIESFDDVFKGTQCVYNWASDFEMELGNAALDDSVYAEQRIDFCREYIERYGDPLEFNIRNMEMAIAESYFRLGKAAEGDQLFEQLLAREPEWGCEWISWSDQYHFGMANKDNDLNKAIDILKRGLDVEGLDDRGEVLERLREIYHELGMHDQARELDEEIGEIRAAIWPDSGEYFSDTKVATPVVVPKKVGRNEPCPCGSGKKYKKCCGR